MQLGLLNKNLNLFDASFMTIIVWGGKLLWLVMSDSDAWPSMLCYALLHGILSCHSYIFLLFLYFVNSERPRALIGELNCTEILLRILQEYDILSKT